MYILSMLIKYFICDRRIRILIYFVIENINQYIIENISMIHS